MIELGPCEIVGVFGPVASGKTYLIDRWLDGQNRYVRFDVTGETIDRAGIEHIWHSPLQLHDRLLLDPKRRHYFRIAYHPGRDLERDFYECLAVCWRSPVYKLLVVDEFHEVCSVNDTPDYVRTMLRYARHDHLALIGASQRIADVSKLFTSGCRMVILYWTQEARDLIAIQDRWGKQTAEAVRNLRPLIYDDVSKTTKQIPQCVVCTKSAPPYIYDFQTNKVLAIASEPAYNVSGAEYVDPHDRTDDEPGDDNEAQQRDEGET